MKRKSRVEAQAFLQKHRPSGREKHPIQQFAFLRAIAVAGYLAKWCCSVSDRAAEMGKIPFPLIEMPRDVGIDEACISRNPDHLIELQSINHAICQEIVINPHIIVDKDKNVVGRLLNASVVYLRKTRGIGERDMDP